VPPSIGPHPEEGSSLASEWYDWPASVFSHYPSMSAEDPGLAARDRSHRSSSGGPFRSTFDFLRVSSSQQRAGERSSSPVLQPQRWHQAPKAHLTRRDSPLCAAPLIEPTPTAWTAKQVQLQAPVRTGYEETHSFEAVDYIIKELESNFAGQWPPRRPIAETVNVIITPQPSSARAGDGIITRYPTTGRPIYEQKAFPLRSVNRSAELSSFSTIRVVTDNEESPRLIQQNKLKPSSPAERHKETRPANNLNHVHFEDFSLLPKHVHPLDLPAGNGTRGRAAQETFRSAALESLLTIAAAEGIVRPCSLRQRVEPGSSEKSHGRSRVRRSLLLICCATHLE
jgi:hypothetical protein